MDPLRHVLALLLCVTSAAMAGACAHPGAAPDAAAVAASGGFSLAGRWEGNAHVSGAAPIPLTITLDTAAGRWEVVMVTSLLGDRAVRFRSVTRVGGSVTFAAPWVAQIVNVRARLSGNGRRLDGVVEAGWSAMFSAARAGTADASRLLAEARRVEASRRLAASMVDSLPAAPHADPDSAELITSDIPLFWDAIDNSPPDSLAEFLQRHYLDRATVGVRDFIPDRIMSAEDLAASVRGRRARYDSVRAATLDVVHAEPAIRAALRRLKALYPDALFPDIYFVIGRFNSGGTASKHGLLIGTEMYREASSLPAIVAHELIHFQQHYDGPTLLEQSFLEGSADFLGEMISGTHINSAAHAYGLRHERTLWLEFKPHFDDRTFFPWMYGRPPHGRPNDLGYFIGYRIAEAYYHRMTDKWQAIRDIVKGGEGTVKELVEKSGYDP